MMTLLKSFFFCFFVVIPAWCIADDISFLKIKKELQDFSSTLGYTPTEENYYQLICRKGIELTVREQGILWMELVKLQRPIVSLEDIKEILNAKQKSIKSFKCEFNLTHENKTNKSDVLNGKTNYIYAIKLPSFFIDTRREDADRFIIDHQIFSYTGDRLINIANPQSSLPNARILELPTRSIGFCPDSPFAQAMLYDTNNFDSSHPGFDFAVFFSQLSMVVFEKKEYCNKSECVIVAGMGHRLLLDINRDFSLVKSISYFHHFENTSEGPKTVKRTLLSTRLLSDISDYGNGIWLPSKIENIHYSPNEEVIASDIIQCAKIEINNVSDDFFENIIPNNAIVFDGIRKMTYKQSDSPSIDSLLKETAKSKRILIFRYISVISGLALIFIAIVMKYRQYLKNKRERENRTEDIK
jgi:hypothetical protein